MGRETNEAMWKKKRKQAEIETEIGGVLREASLLTTQGGDGCVGSQMEMGARYERWGDRLKREESVKESEREVGRNRSTRRRRKEG